MDTQAQLAALAEVGELLDEAGHDYWLFGGWAVDFQLGGVTREHDDIDVAVWLRDVESIASLLETHGWRHNPYPDEDGGTGYEREGVRVELTYLVGDDTGRVFIPLRERNALWSKRAPESEVLELHGVRARVIPLGLLRAGKSSPREDHDDAVKDRADFEALSRLPD
jgi:Aminoglycoside-2''-adenylyltransferase